MKKLLMLLLLSISGIVLYAQSIPEFKLKEMSYGMKNMKKLPKKIYISQFRVNFQAIYFDKEVRQGGYMLGGGYSGDVKTSLQMGLNGLFEKDLQDITDDIYKDCIDQIKKQGYEIVTAEQAAGIEFYEDCERKMGGQVSKSQYEGYITAIPSNYEYFVKRTKESGKEKSTFFDKSGKISKQLDGVGVMRIGINVGFARDAESQGSKLLFSLSKGAKVVAEASVHIANIGLGLANGDISGNTSITYDARTGLADQLSANWTLKDEIELEGLVERKKYKSQESADIAWTPTNIGLFNVFMVNDKFLKKTYQVDVDRNKYISTVSATGKKIIKNALDDLFSNL